MKRFALMELHKLYGTEAINGCEVYQVVCNLNIYIYALSRCECLEEANVSVYRVGYVGKLDLKCIHSLARSLALCASPISPIIIQRGIKSCAPILKTGSLSAHVVERCY